MGVNVVAISGNLTRDAELRATQSGTSVLGFCVAVNDRCKNQQTGEWEDRPSFIDCAVFGARADGLAPYLKKGQKVCVSGRLRQSRWVQDDQTRSKVDVLADGIEFAFGSPSRVAVGAGPRQDQPAALYGQDIPF